jgi:hypothetical protein
MPRPPRPTRRPGESEQDYQRRLASWVSQVGTYEEPEPVTYPGGTTATPTPTPRGYQSGTYVAPSYDDYWFAIDNDPNSATYGHEIRVAAGTPGAWHETALYNEDLAAYNAAIEGPVDTYHPPAWRPGEYELEVQDRAQVAAAQESANMVNYLDSVATGIELDLAAGRLELDQAAEEFDRRLEAFAEGGRQMAEMWQWTVPRGSAGQPLHADIREALGMRPWISDPMTIDPVAKAQEIVESMPPMSPVPSTDPYDEAVAAAQGLLG